MPLKLLIVFFVAIRVWTVPALAVAADLQPCFSIVPPSVTEDKPVLKLSAECLTYKSRMQKLSESLSEYREVWRLMGPDYYYYGCKGGCQPGYVLRKISRDMANLIEDARRARSSLVQLTSIDFANELDDSHDWMIPNDAHDLQSDYPVVPSFLSETNSFSCSYNEPTLNRSIPSKYSYLSQIFGNRLAASYRGLQSTTR